MKRKRASNRGFTRSAKRKNNQNHIRPTRGGYRF